MTTMFPTIARMLLTVTILLGLPSYSHAGLLNLFKKSGTPTMHDIETQKFNWAIYMSSYNVDLGGAPLETHASECWMTDAQGRLVARWYGGWASWGGGGSPMGGGPRLASLPKTLRLTYYDYLEDRFYQLNTELPQKKLYELFSQKTIDLDWAKGQITPRYDEITFGVAPQGYVVVWASGDNGNEQAELGTYQAQVMTGYTAERYNREVKPGFPIMVGAERWVHLKESLKPATLAKLKQGWLPDNLYYKQQRTRYPWRFEMTGNARMLEIKERTEDQGRHYTHPWEMQAYRQFPMMRGLPKGGLAVFNDKDGIRYSLAFSLWTQDRVTGEPDMSAVWAAFEKLFPGRTPEDNAYGPGDADMATVELHVRDDLKELNAYLVKGDQRIELPLGDIQLFKLAPWANNPGGPTPPPEVIKRQQYGPDAE